MNKRELIPSRYVANTLPPLGREVLREAAAIADPAQREIAIQKAHELLRALYPDSFTKE